MSEQQAFPPLSAERDTGALAAGGRAVLAAEAARAAELLFHNGDYDAALAQGRRAMAFDADETALRTCARVFSNCGGHAEAAEAYRQLLDLDPDWIDGYRHLSRSLAEAGQLDGAIAAAITASDAGTHNAEYAVHAGSLLSCAQRYDEAAFYLEQAAALAPDKSDIVIPAAELLMQQGRAERACELLRRLAMIDRSPRLSRVLSSAEMVCGRFEAALAAVEAAIAAAPSAAEFHIHRAHLLAHLGETPAAAAALEQAAALEPDNGDIKRARLGLLLAAGLVTEATAAGGELLHRFPDDRASAEAVFHLLTRRLDTIDGDYAVVEDGVARAPRPVRAPLGWIERLRTQQRVIVALMIRETRTRFGDSKLGYGWALIEPILHITVLSVTFSVLMHGRPPIGEEFFIFYYTGLIPYLVFIHTSSGMSHAVVANGPLLQLPPVKPFDVIAARGLLEIATDAVVAVLLLLGFGAVGLNAMPDDLWTPAVAFLVAAAFGCGLGYVNAVLTVLFRSWERSYAQITRVLYFISGIFYVPAMMPDWARDTLAWNPLLHAIDWFRSGFFANYQPHWLDRSYLVSCALAALFAGFALERAMRRKLSAPL